MELTGQCKKDFEKWFFKDYLPKQRITIQHAWFPSLPFSMQYGVFVDFFDSVGIYIDDYYEHNRYKVLVNKRIDGSLACAFDTDKIKTRSEARQKAIEKANEIYNSKP